MDTPEKNADLLARLSAIVGTAGLLTARDDIAPYLTDWRGLYIGTARAVVRPANRDELAAVVKLCAELKISIVPQGGNTGMCGAATPAADCSGVVICLSRMNRILNVDALNNTMTVEAGVVPAVDKPTGTTSGPEVVLDDILVYLLEKGGSDVHLTVKSPPMIRVHGDLEPVPRYRDLTPTQLKESIYAILTDRQKQRFEETHEQIGRAHV